MPQTPSAQKVRDTIDWMLREELPDGHMDILKQWVDGYAKKVDPFYLETRLSMKHGSKRAKEGLACVQNALKKVREESGVTDENLIRHLCEDLELEIPLSSC